jgi:hypothetical protein
VNVAPQVIGGVKMFATASSSTGSTLIKAAQACNFIGFAWQQMIWNLPCDYNPNIHQFSSGVFPNVLSDIPQQDLCPDFSITASTMNPMNDPPNGGTTDLGSSYNPFPFYYPWPNVEIAESNPNSPSNQVCYADPPGACAPLVTAGGYVLIFGDTPSLPPWAPTASASSTPAASSSKGFTTTLVGVSAGQVTGSMPCDPSGKSVYSSLYCTGLYWWSWNTTYNGSAGGITLLDESGLNAASSANGTGGITITSINGVQLPPVIPSSQIAATASGLPYSRVSKTFNGTVTLKNISASVISGPIQIVFFGLPANVTLVNATSNLSGTPYLTVPGAATLAPGQSVTVSVQFKNPSNATISLTPAIYAGTIN